MTDRRSCPLGRQASFHPAVPCPDDPSLLVEAALADRYIVVLKDRAGQPAAVASDHAERFGAEVKSVYGSALKGYAARIPEGRLAAVRQDPQVAYVEADGIVRAQRQEIPTGVRRVFADENPELGINGRDDTRVDADIAVLDGGVDGTHPDLHLVGRTDCTYGDLLKSLESDTSQACLDHAGYDDQGHGTHVAGTAAALDNGRGVVGVAPGARLWSVKVLSNNIGLMSWVIAGVDWATARAEVIDVVNMSLGCECEQRALDEAISNSVARGVVYAVAAGNFGLDAENTSPANHPDVITVSSMADFDGEPGGIGASTCLPPEFEQKDDYLAVFSNFGESIEVSAPGVCIRSTSIRGRYEVLSGTSMASPHVAGAAAVLVSGSKKPSDKAGVEAIRQTIMEAGNLDWTDEVPPSCGRGGCTGGGSPDGVQEPLLDVHDSTVFAPAEVTARRNDNVLPVASFVRTCDARLRCDFDGRASFDKDGRVATYTWEFGDGKAPAVRGVERSAGPVVSHRFARSGTYLVVLTITDDQGAVGTQWASVTVSKGLPLAQPQCRRPSDTKCEAWIRAYDNPNGYNVDGFTGFGLDFVTSMVASPDGNRVFVTGWSWDNATESLDAATVAYDRAGRQLWVARYDGPADLDEIPYGIAVSPDGRRVYTTGTQDVCYIFGGCNTPEDYRSERFDAVTVAYDAETGQRLWSSRFGSRDVSDLMMRVTVSEDGTHVIATGSSGRFNGYVTISYDAVTGAEEWRSRHRESGDSGSNAIALATHENRVYVSGYSDGDYATVAYELTGGKRLWTARFDSGGFDVGGRVAASLDGTRVYVSGTTSSFSNDTVTTIAYDAATGIDLWTSSFKSVGIQSVGMAVSPAGDRIFVAGVDRPAIDVPGLLHAISYDAASGSQVWAAQSPSGFSMGAALAISPDGASVYLADNVPSGTGPEDYNASDLITLSYRASDGAAEWAARYNSSPRGIQQNYPSVAASPDGKRLYVAGDFFTDRIGSSFVNPRNISRYGIVAYDTRVRGAFGPPIYKCPTSAGQNCAPPEHRAQGYAF